MKIGPLRRSRTKRSGPVGRNERLRRRCLLPAAVVPWRGRDASPAGRALPDCSAARVSALTAAQSVDEVAGAARRAALALFVDSAAAPLVRVHARPRARAFPGAGALVIARPRPVCVELYVDELKDLWSANDQMVRALKKIQSQATNPKLAKMLKSAQSGIAEHTTLLKSLIEGQDETVKKEHCKGMEGLVTEAIKHTVDEAPEKGPVLDASIIAQYQRMTHYGITGFGTVSAFAKALGLEEDQSKLSAAVDDMAESDELMTELAESAVNPAGVR